MQPTHAIIQLLADCAVHLGMGQHSYIVGGAPRDHVLGYEVKDVDVVVEQVIDVQRPPGVFNALTLGSEVARRAGLQGAHADGLGVVHLGPFVKGTQYAGADLEGQKVEIVTARREKYNRARGKDSHKPFMVEPGTILEDLKRRDFTINTLMWRLGDLTNGIEGVEAIDLLGGLTDIQNKLLETPLDPNETFDDDPSRILRGIRFAIKYDFKVEPMTLLAMSVKAAEIRRLPYEAIDPLFFDKILTMSTEKVRNALAYMNHVGVLEHIREMIPKSRMRRAIQERVKDFRLILALANWGFDVGVPFRGTQLERLTSVSRDASDEELQLLAQRFRVPFDTERYIQATGATGRAIGEAVERGRDLVLLGMSSERVLEVLIEGRP